MNTLSFPPVFVINLARSIDRRTTIAKHLDALNIKYHFIDAIDGHTLDINTLPTYNKITRRRFFGRDLLPTEMGCLLSHRAVYQHIVDKQIKYALIVEDDIQFHADFLKVIHELLALPLQWDMIRFLGPDNEEKTRKKSRLIGTLKTGHKITRLRPPASSAFCYLLTIDAAQCLLHHTQYNTLPIDRLHGHVWQTNLNIYIIRPTPVSINNENISTIGEIRFDKTLQLTGLQKKIYLCTRFYYRMTVAIGSHFFHLRRAPKDYIQRWRLKTPSTHR